MWYLIVLILFLICLVSFNKPEITKTKISTYVRGYILFYTDQKVEKREEGVIYSKLLESERYGIKGKPDYILKSRNGNKYLPIELKSGVIGDLDMPKEGDLMQLVMYFLIIEDLYGIRPKEGRLIYKDSMFIIKNTTGLRKQLIEVLEDMKDMLNTGKGFIDPGFIKCKHCMCRGTVCEFLE